MKHHATPLDRRLHTLTLATIRAGCRAARHDLAPEAREMNRVHAVSLAKAAFAAAIWDGIDISPAFIPTTANTRPWKHNRPRTIIEALQACYATVEAMDSTMETPGSTISSTTPSP